MPNSKSEKILHPREKQFRLALVGAGRFAHLYHLPAILKDSRAELVIICDPLPSPHTEKIANELGVPIVKSIDAVLTPDRCDAVVISTPHKLHSGQVRKALEAGKHVLVDKPFVMHSTEAAALSEFAQREGLLGAVAFNQRFSRAYLHARAVIGTGRLGTIRRVESLQLGGEWVAAADGNAPRETGSLRPFWYLDPDMAGGGVLVGRGAHMADAIPWILGRSPNRIRARVYAGRSNEVDRGGEADLDFGDFMWHFTTVADPSPLWDDVRIYGSEGRLEIQKPEGTLGYWEISHESISGKGVTVPTPGIDDVSVKNFLDALSGLRKLSCDFDDACISVRILEAIYESGRHRGKWITV